MLAFFPPFYFFPFIFLAFLRYLNRSGHIMAVGAYLYGRNVMFQCGGGLPYSLLNMYDYDLIFYFS